MRGSIDDGGHHWLDRDEYSSEELIEALRLPEKVQDFKCGDRVGVPSTSNSPKASNPLEQLASPSLQDGSKPALTDFQQCNVEQWTEILLGDAMRHMTHVRT